PAPGKTARHRRRRLGDGRVAAWEHDGSLLGGDDHTPRCRFRALPLGRREEHQPGDDLLAGPDLENPRVQGVRRATRAGGGAGIRTPTRTAAVTPPPPTPSPTRGEGELEVPT